MTYEGTSGVVLAPLWSYGHVYSATADLQIEFAKFFSVKGIVTGFSKIKIFPRVLTLFSAILLFIVSKIEQSGSKIKW